MKHHRHLTIGCLAAVVLAVSGCGSDTAGSTSTDGAGSTSTVINNSPPKTPPDETSADEAAPDTTGPDTTPASSAQSDTSQTDSTAPATTAPTTTPATTAQPDTTVPATTLAPPIVAGFAPLALTEPPAGAASSTTPLFGWQPIDGAATYRLVVVGPAGPIWAWEGSATSVRLGGLTSDRPAGFSGPSIIDGSSWSVVALDAAGQLVAVSESREIGAS